MKPATAVLAGAAVAAMALLVILAVARLTGDPEVRDCASASRALDTANDAHLDAMRVLEGRFRRGGEPAEVASLRVKQAKAEVDAARVAFQLACRYREPTT